MPRRPTRARRNPAPVPSWLEDAFPSAVEALQNGTSWSYEPDDVDADGQFAPYQCGESDCDAVGGWHNLWLVPGYSVENGVFYLDTWAVDDSGNWDINESEPYTPESEDNISREAREAALRYFRWVARNGKDPLDEFVVFLSTPGERSIDRRRGLVERANAAIRERESE